MTPQLLETIDPRDTLERARRSQLWRFAREHGVAEIDDPGMPAVRMRKILRSKGLIDVGVQPQRQVETPPAKVVNGDERREPEVKTMTAEELAEIEWQNELAARAAAQPAKEKPLAEMGVFELRGVAKKRGLSAPRTATRAQLLEMLGGGNAA